MSVKAARIARVSVKAAQRCRSDVIGGSIVSVKAARIARVSVKAAPRCRSDVIGGSIATHS